MAAARAAEPDDRQLEWLAGALARGGEGIAPLTGPPSGMSDALTGIAEALSDAGRQWRRPGLRPRRRVPDAGGRRDLAADRTHRARPEQSGRGAAGAGPDPGRQPGSMARRPGTSPGAAGSEAQRRGGPAAAVDGRRGTGPVRRTGGPGRPAARPGAFRRGGSGLHRRRFSACPTLDRRTGACSTRAASPTSGRSAGHRPRPICSRRSSWSPTSRSCSTISATAGSTRGSTSTAPRPCCTGRSSCKPDDGYIVDSLGWAYFRLGENDKAVTYLERAVELEPARSGHQRPSGRCLLAGRAAPARRASSGSAR